MRESQTSEALGAILWSLLARGPGLLQEFEDDSYNYGLENVSNHRQAGDDGKL